MNPFQSLRDYERFVYTLSPRFASIQYLTTSTFHPTSNIIVFPRRA
jgi:hypothetical protein